MGGSLSKELVAQRQRRLVENRKASGHSRLTVWLEPEAAKAVEFLMAKHPERTKVEIINRAVRYLAIRAQLDARELEEALKGTAEIPAP